MLSTEVFWSKCSPMGCDDYKNRPCICRLRKRKDQGNSWVDKAFALLTQGSEFQLRTCIKKKSQMWYCLLVILMTGSGGS